MDFSQKRGEATKRISRHMAKYICFVVSGILISSFIISVAIKTLHFIKNDNEERTRSSSEMLVHEYALASKYLFREACAELKQFSESRTLLLSDSPEYITAELKKRFLSAPIYFCNVAYSLPDGTTFLSNGKQINLEKYPFLELFKNPGTVDFVMGPVESKLTGKPVIIVSRPMFLNNGSVKAVVSASIELDTIMLLTNRLDIKNEGRFFILGDDGRFICHYNEAVLGNSYTPKDADYRNMNSEFFWKLKRGVFRTISMENKLIDVYLEPIEGTDFTCGVTTEVSKMMKTYSRFKAIIIKVIFVTIFMVIVLAVISLWFLNNNNIWESSIDPLTEMWTRPKFEKEAQQLLEKNKGARFVVMEIDFRGFKFINQSYGTEYADKILIHFSKIFAERCKAVGSIYGRGYADHFYVCAKINSVREFMENLDEAINATELWMQEYESPCYPKYGITFVLPDKLFYNAPKNILDLIGEASYAKSTIKNNLLQVYSIFSSKMEQQIQKEQRIERHMEKALDRGEFFVMYQPKIDLVDDKIKGAEALVRWNSSNPKLGCLSPADFVPVFERNGFIVKLDFAVYEMVFRFLRAQLDAGKPVVPISVNMSRNHSNPDKFVKEFVHIFNKYDLPPELIEIEILERAAEGDSYNLIRVTEKLHEYGFTVAMDDFGSGQSSLNMLSEIPIDVLKFDQNFLKSQSTKENRFGLITSLIELGKKLNKKTLFEGVETIEQRDMLKDLQCDQVQGYFYSKPLAEEAFVDFISDHM